MAKFFIDFLIGPDNGGAGDAVPRAGPVGLLLLRMDDDGPADNVRNAMELDHLVDLVHIALAVFTCQIANLSNFAVSTALFPAKR